MKPMLFNTGLIRPLNIEPYTSTKRLVFTVDICGIGWRSYVKFLLGNN